MPALRDCPTSPSGTSAPVADASSKNDHASLNANGSTNGRNKNPGGFTATLLYDAILAQEEMAKQIAELKEKLEQTQIRDDDRQVSKKERELAEKEGRLNVLGHELETQEAELVEYEYVLKKRKREQAQREIKLAEKEKQLAEIEGKLVEKTNELSSKESKMKEQIRLADEFMEKVKSTRALLEENEKLLAVRKADIENREKHCDDEQQRMAVQGRGLNEKEQRLAEWQERLEIRSQERAAREQRSWAAQNTPSPLQPGVNTSTSNKMVTFIKFAPARQQFVVQGGSKIKDGSDVNDFDIQLLRIHDYYKGWLDGIKSVEAEEACRRRKVSKHKIREVHRENNPFGQYNAGFHVGMYFNWSQACHAQGKSQWATCLDQRQWRASDLVPDYHQVANTFWEGVRHGKQSAWAKFQEELRKERGN